MQFTNYVLQLLENDEFRKEAASPTGQTEPFSPGIDQSTYLKGVAIRAGVPLAAAMLGKGVNYLMNSRSQTQNNALFDQIMARHPGLAGKDPLRAKANFDYLMKETPHLADHPLILGDHVANMTAMGTTDPATLNMLAGMMKSRTDARRETGGPSPILDILGEGMANAYLKDKIRAPVPVDQNADFLARNNLGLSAAVNNVKALADSDLYNEFTRPWSPPETQEYADKRNRLGGLMEKAVANAKAVPPVKV